MRPESKAGQQLIAKREIDWFILLCNKEGMDNALTLPVGQLQEWTDEIARIDAAIGKLTAEREAYLAKIDAVRLLFGDDAAPDLPMRRGKGAKADEPTLIGFIREQIEQAEQGIALTELAVALRASPLAEKFEKNPNAVYTAVARLVERREAVREGRLVYSPAVYERVRAGLVEKRNVVARDGSVPALIAEAVKRAGKALTSGEILDELRKDEEMATRLAVNPQVGYTAVSRMVHKGQLVKVGKRYMLPSPVSDQDGLTRTSAP